MGGACPKEELHPTHQRTQPSAALTRHDPIPLPQLHPAVNTTFSMCWWTTSCGLAASMGYFDDFAQCVKGRQGACTGKRCAGSIFKHYLLHRADPQAAFQCLRDLVASGSLTASEKRDIGAANWQSQHCAELSLRAVASLGARHTTGMAR